MTDRDIRICFVGDSFVSGMGDPSCLGWTGRVCAAAARGGHELTYYNLGIRRDTSADIAGRWRRECEVRLPRSADGRVVLSFGVNDATLEDGRLRVEPGATLARVRSMLAEARSLYPTLFVGPPPIDHERQNERIEALDHAMAQVADEVGAPYLSVFRTLIDSTTWMREVRNGDGAHPREAGYAELAALVTAWDAWWFVGREP